MPRTRGSSTPAKNGQRNQGRGSTPTMSRIAASASLDVGRPCRRRTGAACARDRRSGCRRGARRRATRRAVSGNASTQRPWRKKVAAPSARGARRGSLPGHPAGEAGRDARRRTSARPASASSPVAASSRADGRAHVGCCYSYKQDGAWASRCQGAGPARETGGWSGRGRATSAPRRAADGREDRRRRRRQHLHPRARRGLRHPRGAPRRGRAGAARHRHRAARRRRRPRPPDARPSRLGRPARDDDGPRRGHRRRRLRRRPAPRRRPGGPAARRDHPAAVRLRRPGDDRAGRVRQGPAHGAGGPRPGRARRPPGREGRLDRRLHQSRRDRDPGAPRRRAIARSACATWRSASSARSPSGSASIRRGSSSSTSG